MKRIKIIGSALVTAAAVSAVLAAGASAATPPEWGQCQLAATKGTGEYKGKGCVASANGKGVYNWAPEPVGKAIFTGSGEEPSFETPGKRKITCAATSYEGKFTGPKTAEVIMSVIGCNFTKGTEKQQCSTHPKVPGHEGEMEAEYTAELGFIKGGEKPQVGLDLKPKSTIVFACGLSTEPIPLLSGKVEGSLIGKISPINHAVEEFKLLHRVVAGKQSVQNFEGGSKDTFTAELTEPGIPPVIVTEELGLRQTSTVGAEAESLEIRTKA